MDTETTQAPVAKPKKAAKPKKKAASRAVAIHQPRPPAQPPAPRSFLEVIATAATDPACNPEKMQALLDMQERIEERAAKKAFTVAFNALQAELPIITKDGKIDHGEGTTARGNKKLKTTFATYPNLNRVCGPLMKKHGFTFSTSMVPEASGAMVAVSTLEHVGGASRSTSFRLTADSTGGKNNQQGWGSSQQYGMRYNMIALLNIVSEAPQDADNDGFAKTNENLISKNQLDELVALAKDVKADVLKFCDVMGVEDLKHLPADRFEEAKAQLNRKRKRSDFPGDNPL